MMTSWPLSLGSEDLVASFCLLIQLWKCFKSGLVRGASLLVHPFVLRGLSVWKGEVCVQIWTLVTAGWPVQHTGLLTSSEIHFAFSVSYFPVLFICFMMNFSADWKLHSEIQHSLGQSSGEICTPRQRSFPHFSRGQTLTFLRSGVDGLMAESLHKQCANNLCDSSWASSCCFFFSPWRHGGCAVWWRSLGGGRLCGPVWDQSLRKQSGLLQCSSSPHVITPRFSSEGNLQRCSEPLQRHQHGRVVADEIVSKRYSAAKRVIRKFPTPLLIHTNSISINRRALCYH